VGESARRDDCDEHPCQSYAGKKGKIFERGERKKVGGMIAVDTAVLKKTGRPRKRGTGRPVRGGKK